MLPNNHQQISDKTINAIALVFLISRLGTKILEYNHDDANSMHSTKMWFILLPPPTSKETAS